MSTIQRYTEAREQPPKRRPPAAAAPKAAPKKRASKLAKENDITADQEAEIQEAFALFALQEIPGYEDEKEGVLQADDVRRCLMYVYTHKREHG